MHSASRWNSRMLSIGMSLAINCAIVGILARVLAAPSGPAETRIEVELEHVSVAQVRRDEPPKLMIARVSSAPQPRQTSTTAPPPPREQRPQSRLSLPRLDLSAFFGAHPPDPGPATSRSDSETSTGGSIEGGTGPGVTGGTTGSGPGAASSHGDGTGTTLAGPSGSGGTKDPPTAVAGNREEVRKGEPTPVKPEKPAPRGESRDVKPAKQPRPAYPSDARDEEIEGAVTLIAVVGADGKVSEVRLEKGLGDRRLDRAAENGVKQWTYSPALRDGVPVKSNVRVRVEFRLE